MNAEDHFSLLRDGPVEETTTAVFARVVSLIIVFSFVSANLLINGGIITLLARIPLLPLLWAP